MCIKFVQDDTSLAARPTITIANELRSADENLVDTSVWSLALRRRVPDLNPQEHLIVRELAELVREGRQSLPGERDLRLNCGYADMRGSAGRDLPVFTSDPDFAGYARVLPLKRYEARQV